MMIWLHSDYILTTFWQHPDYIDLWLLLMSGATLISDDLVEHKKIFFKSICFADVLFWIPGPSQPYPTSGALGRRLSKNSNDSGSNSELCPWLDFYAHCLLLSVMWKRLGNICEDFKLWKQSFTSNLFSLKLDLLQSPRVFNFSAMHSNAMIYLCLLHYSVLLLLKSKHVYLRGSH